ncbi:hypothetical protein LP085_08585 [Achromobacter sp. MY14]|uniref:hypothetical protein n=1 Tax=unclassified Achromobacter TaxID=2626865 RepID=UPI001E3E24AC|nr:hypothetical protein [Achromobacter sp. MY14]MCD0496900.1 hypothetical protein [Achromobacter sp. MY14]
MTSTARYQCQTCGGTFTARTADRARGWARFCSKSCKANKQAARAGQHRGYLARRDSDESFPSLAEGDVQ